LTRYDETQTNAKTISDAIFAQKRVGAKVESASKRKFARKNSLIRRFFQKKRKKRRDRLLKNRRGVFDSPA